MARKTTEIRRPASYTNASCTPRPQLPPRPQTRPAKPKGLPLLGERLDIGLSPDTDSDTSPVSTPYRLPRIKAAEPEDLCKVWSRHGYDAYTSKPIELQILASQVEASPRVLSQEIRRAHHLAASYPNFRNAVISPVQKRSSRKIGSAFYNGFVQRPATVRTDDSRLFGVDGEGHSSSPVKEFSRCSSPAKSAKSIKWALTPYRNTKIDRKGRSRQQGPFSREFTVTCAAPNNWLRRKFTRAKTCI